MNKFRSSIRKKQHIQLASIAQFNHQYVDKRFYYEPLLGTNKRNLEERFPFLDKSLKAPIWISAVTGGTRKAKKINYNLAGVCKQFGIGLNTGSCRQLLYSDRYFNDFDVREYCGNEIPFYINLGIAQIEKLLVQNKLSLVNTLISRLRADGLVIHCNLLQEWIQPEGDIIQIEPLQTIKELIRDIDFPIIVKEVGQGFGPQSLSELLKLPLAAIEFGALGGTNFSKMESLRLSGNIQKEIKSTYSYLGHTAEEMVNYVNNIYNKSKTQLNCREIIISGGIKSALDGYYLIHKCQLNSIYGIAYRALVHAARSYAQLSNFIAAEIEAYAIASSLLRIK